MTEPERQENKKYNYNNKLNFHEGDEREPNTKINNYYYKSLGLGLYVCIFRKD